MKTKEKIRGGSIIAKPYDLLSECVEMGIEAGKNRARKHTDNPDEQTENNAIYNAIMINISERFEFKP